MFDLSTYTTYMQEQIEQMREKVNRTTKSNYLLIEFQMELDTYVHLFDLAAKQGTLARIQRYKKKLQEELEYYVEQKDYCPAARVQFRLISVNEVLRLFRKHKFHKERL